MGLRVFGMFGVFGVFWSFRSLGVKVFKVFKVSAFGLGVLGCSGGVYCSRILVWGASGV